MVGDVVKALREARGWNQSELGRHAGLKPGYISQVEDGTKRNLTQKTLEKLAGAFEMPLPRFMEAIGVGKQAPSELNGLVSDTLANRLFRSWPDLTDAEHLGVVLLVETLSHAKRGTPDAEAEEPPQTIGYLGNNGR